MYTCKPPFEGQVPQVTQAPEIAKVSPSSISASLRMTGEAICYPSGSRPGWALPPFWGQERKHRVSHIGDWKSKKQRWNEVRRDSRTFLFMVHLVPRLLVPETACGFYSVLDWCKMLDISFLRILGTKWSGLVASTGLFVGKHGSSMTLTYGLKL